MHAAPVFPTPPADAAPQRLATLAERLSRTLAVARALSIAGRHVDLTGIEDGVGLLCAKTLDLSRTDAKGLLPALYEVLAQLDSLRLAMQPPGGSGA
jgi:hypothetical protein